MTRTYTYNNIKRCMLAVAMMGSAVCTWAQTNVAKIETKEYATLQAAIDAATEGQTVTLIANITETQTYTIDKAITIDLGAYSITASHNDASSVSATKVFDITSAGNLTITGTGTITDAKVSGIFYNAGQLTINGGNYTTTVDDYGVVVNDGGTCTVAGGALTGAYTAIYTKGSNSVTVSNGTLNGAFLGIQANVGTTLNITGGTITATNQAKKYPGIQLKGEGTSANISGGTISGFNGITVLEKASLTVSETANISGKNLALCGNGTEGSGGTTITINGGTMTSDDTGIYHPQDGTLTIAGGTITGEKLGVEIRAGELSVTGGSITSSADTYSCVANNNGTTTIGAALAIAQHTTKKNITVTISGGEFTGVKAISESNPQNNDPAPQVTMSVTNGTFNGGITVEDVQGGFIEGGTFSEAFPATYCVDGKAPYVDENGACTIITPATEVPAEAEALSNDTYYKVLNGAITAAGTTATTINVLKDPTAETITIPATADITLEVANSVTLAKPITNYGALTIDNGTVSSTITISNADATVKIADAVTPPTVALNTELQTAYVLKLSTTTVSGYKSYWVEKKIEATVNLTDPTAEQTAAAEALVANTSISTVNGLTVNQSLTITVTSVELTNSKVMKATFEVKLIGADGQEVTGTVDPAVTFYLPICDGLEGKWVNLWHNITAIPGMNVVGATNGYVTVTTTTFSPFSYEIIENPVAQIDLTKYASVADAITDAPTSPATATEISLLVDVAATQTGVTIPQGKNIKLTIGTHTVSDAITNAGTLNICDGTNPEGTSGVISGAITNTGTLNISDKANISGAVSASAGTITISGGSISNAITTSSNAGLTISGGTITGALTVGGSGTNTISGGTISGDVTTSAATAISGGEISGNISNSDALTITNGTFTGTITNTDPGTVAISGGTHKKLPVSGYCATGYMPIKNDAGKYNMTNHWTITDATVVDASHFDYLTSSAGYKVATATYERNTGMFSAGNAKTKYGTICLPFQIKAAPTNMTLYKATSISGSTLTITAVTYDAPIEAGTPLIFELSQAASTMTVTSTDGVYSINVNTGTPATSPASDNLLVGTYTEKTITEGLTSIYYLNGDTFHKALSSLKVPAFRAYLKTSTQGGAKPMILSIVKDGDEATDISAVEAFEGVTNVYDLNGRKQNGLQRGVNIMRRADGSSFKVIVK